METARSSTVVISNYSTTRPKNPENHDIYIHRREKHKCNNEQTWILAPIYAHV
jgi:hypothetical protein